MAASLIQSAANNLIDAGTGQASHNTLQTFLNGISQAHSNGIKIREPDPLNTFDVKFTFYPSIGVSLSDKKGVFSAMADSLVSSAKSAVKNSLNNLTGGLLGSFMNAVDVQGEHDKFTTIKSEVESHSFIEYLAKANLLCGTESTWLGGMGEITSPLQIDMTYFIQKMTLPALKMDGGMEEVETRGVGKFPMNGTFLTPDTHTLTMDILNTKVPVLERIFYPWMKEVTLPYWSYSTQPYTTATIEVDFTSHSDVKYQFIGCRPSQINTYQPDQATPSDMVRQVSMLFDYMFVNSDLNTTESIASKLGSLGKTLFNSGANMFKL